MAESAKDARALILVNVQNDFLPPNGSLAVTGGRAILPVVLDLLSKSYDLIVATGDYHPKGHISFASTHGKPPFTAIDVPKWNEPGETISQMLWPDHCVQKSDGSEVESSIQERLDQIQGVHYILKGTNIAVDAYSGFADVGYAEFTNVPEILYTHGIKTVIVAGFTTDYCVRDTAIDACKFGFRTLVVGDAIRALYPEKVDSAFEEMKRWGCEIVSSDSIPK